AFCLSPRQPLADQRLAITFALDARVYDEGPKQRAAFLAADLDRGEADAAHERIVQPAGAAQAGHRRNALAHAIRAAGKSAGPTGLRGKFRQSRRIGGGLEADFKGHGVRTKFAGRGESPTGQAPNAILRENRTRRRRRGLSSPRKAGARSSSGKGRI